MTARKTTPRAKPGPKPKSVADFNPPDPPNPPVESKVFDNKTVAANIFDALSVDDEPMSAPSVAHLIDVPVAVVTTILDDLVSAGDLLLGDDQRYSIVITSVTSETPETPETPELPGQEESVPPADNFVNGLTGNVQTVRIPTSDLFSFLTNINLPPQFLAGLGALHDISGFLSFEVVDPTPDDPRPVGKVHATIYGRHAHVARHLNPNQPGYVSPVTMTLLAPVVEP